MKKSLEVIIVLIFMCSIMNDLKIQSYYYEDTVEYKSNPATDSKRIMENAVEVFNFIGK